jgi:hypothetical protein
MPTDSLVSPPPPKPVFFYLEPPNRVFYSLGRMLGVEDFQTEQDYHRGRLARALQQLCGAGTVCGLKVRVPQFWEPNTFYVASAHVVDPNGDIEFNTGADGLSGATQPIWPTATGDTIADGTKVVWTNIGTVMPNGWQPSKKFKRLSAIIDRNGNLQVLTSAVTTGSTEPLWNTATGGTTGDGGNGPATPGFSPAAWTCAGPADWPDSSQLEIQVTPGIAIDRAGRILEVPRTVCIRLQPWLDQQSTSDLTTALHGGNILIDVFAKFAACTRGATPCFATQDDYDATDAFSPNGLLDSFAMELVLRSDATPGLPKDPWAGVGAFPPAPNPDPQVLKQAILDAAFGPAASTSEYPPKYDDLTAVFLARIAVPAAAGPPLSTDVMHLSIDNFSRLFVIPPSLVARWAGLSSGTES